ncbi:hypothetical protein Thu_102 [Bacillus phage Thurquoise]|nr:hypothetical protein Thu_102 [Bacillus phage Thurquoise]
MPTVRATGQITVSDLNDARQLILYLNANYKTQIYDPNTQVYNPHLPTTNLVITPELYIAGVGNNMLPSATIKSLFWYEGTQTTVPLAETAGGTTPSGLSYTLPTGALASTAKPLTIKSNLASMNSQSFTCVITYTDPDLNMDTVIRANVEMVKITNGQIGTNVTTAILSNDSQNIPTDSSGGGAIYAGSGTDIHVYDGSTELQHDGVGTANGKYKVTAVGSQITPGAITTSGLYAVVAVASNIQADTASITFTVTGKTLTGTPFTLTKLQTFNKAKMGAAPTAYWLVMSAAAMQRNVSNVLTPGNIVINMMSQTGSGAPAFYGGKLTIEEQASDGTWSSKYSPNTVETGAKTWTPTATSIKAIRIKMYLSNANLPADAAKNVDEQQVVVVADGATGVDSYYLNVWAPGGDSIRNSGGNLTLQADMYKGAGSIAPTSFQWYIQDSTATPAGSNGSDADGGAGWRRINTVANPTTAPTLASAVNAASQLTATTYFVKYTWCGLSGETIGSSEAQLAVTAGKDLKVTIPAFGANVTAAKVYIGTATGVLFYAGDITTSAGSLTVLKFDNTAEAIPTTTTATITSTTASITVRNWSITGVKGYKCVVVVPGTSTKYSGIAVLRDFQDPLVLNIIGTNVFKNGQGTITLTGQLLQAGLTVSTAGFTFNWGLYNTNGILIKNYPTVLGDTITLDSTDVNGSANLVADASK